MKDISIGNKRIGEDHPPFIIAEMSGNHNQSLERALALVDAAAAAGADALKIQTYTADTLTIDHKEGAFFISDENSPWKGQTLYELYEQAHTPWEWHQAIFERAAEKNMLAFSSPFDDTAVDYLENLNVPAYKIASFENTDHRLLKKVAQTGKPIIISTGLATSADIVESLEVLRSNGAKDIVVLQCTSSYPASPRSSNIRTIPHMKALYQSHIGLSDHTLGIGVAVASVALGARVIEKHFTLDRSEGGVDALFSLEPAELKALVEECKRAHESLGNISYGILSEEEKSRTFKRSIYVVKDIAEGEAFSDDNLRVIRPGQGMQPKYIDKVIGLKAKTALKRGTPLTWEMI